MAKKAPCLKAQEICTGAGQMQGYLRTLFIEQMPLIYFMERTLFKKPMISWLLGKFITFH
jgi:hypothetical protein